MANRLQVGIPEPLALRAPDAALVLGVSERKFRELAPSLPSVDLAGVTVYPVDALRDWLAARAETSVDSIDVAVSEALSRVEPDGEDP